MSDHMAKNEIYLSHSETKQVYSTIFDRYIDKINLETVSRMSNSPILQKFDKISFFYYDSVVIHDLLDLAEFDLTKLLEFLVK